MRQKVEKRVPSQSPNCQRDQELDQMLVEDALHDWDHDHTEHPAEGDEEDGGGGGQPDPVVLHHPAALLVLQPHVGRVVGSLCMRVVFVRTVIVALVVLVVVVFMVLMLMLVHVVLCAVVRGLLLALGEQRHAEKAEAVANHQTHLKLS